MLWKNNIYTVFLIIQVKCLFSNPEWHLFFYCCEIKHKVVGLPLKVQWVVRQETQGCVFQASTCSSANKTLEACSLSRPLTCFSIITSTWTNKGVLHDGLRSLDFPMFLFVEEVYMYQYGAQLGHKIQFFFSITGKKQSDFVEKDHRARHFSWCFFLKNFKGKS